MIDNRSSVKSFNIEVYSVVHSCEDLNHPVLDYQKAFSFIILLEDGGAFFVVFRYEGKNHFVDDILRDALQVVD